MNSHKVVNDTNTNEPKDQNIGIPILKQTLTLGQVIALILFILSTLCGGAWYLYTTGSFAPDVELRKHASLNEYSYKKTFEDYRDSIKTNQELQKKISENNIELSQLKQGLEKQRLEIEERISIKKAELESKAKLSEAEAKQKEADVRLKVAEIERDQKILVSKNEMLTGLVRACVEATTAGQTAQAVRETSGSVIGMSGAAAGNAAVAITAIANSQNGPDILNKCLTQYSEKFEHNPSFQKEKTK